MRVGTRRMLITVHLESTKPWTENELMHRGAKLTISNRSAAGVIYCMNVCAFNERVQKR